MFAVQHCFTCRSIDVVTTIGLLSGAGLCALFHVSLVPAKAAPQVSDVVHCNLSYLITPSSHMSEGLSMLSPTSGRLDVISENRNFLFCFF
jgi:hypothetical protein